MSEQQQPPRCETCRYYSPDDPDGNGIKGECRRHTPRNSFEWPMVVDSDWCGEYKPKESQSVPAGQPVTSPEPHPACVERLPREWT